jgi:hypothetical protein
LAHSKDFGVKETGSSDIYTFFGMVQDTKIRRGVADGF